MPLISAEAAVKSLDQSFWKTLDWYTFARSKTKVNAKDDVKACNTYINASRYRDSLILERMVEAFGSIKSDTIKTDVEDAKKRVRRKIVEGRVDIRSRIRFLVCDYCYMLRNRSFHAAKAYPVFVISEEAETKAERALTKILIATIRDFIVSEEFRR